MLEQVRNDKDQRPLAHLLDQRIEGRRDVC